MENAKARVMQNVFSRVNLYSMDVTIEKEDILIAALVSLSGRKVLSQILSDSQKLLRPTFLFRLIVKAPVTLTLITDRH